MPARVPPNAIAARMARGVPIQASATMNPISTINRSARDKNRQRVRSMPEGPESVMPIGERRMAARTRTPSPDAGHQAMAGRLPICPHGRTFNHGASYRPAELTSWRRCAACLRQWQAYADAAPSAALGADDRTWRSGLPLVEAAGQRGQVPWRIDGFRTSCPSPDERPRHKRRSLRRVPPKMPGQS